MTKTKFLVRSVPLLLLALGPVAAKAQPENCGVVTDQWYDETWPTANRYGHSGSCWESWNEVLTHWNDSNFHGSLKTTGYHTDTPGSNAHIPCG